jgi:hypothetical protein
MQQDNQHQREKQGTRTLLVSYFFLSFCSRDVLFFIFSVHDWLNPPMESQQTQGATLFPKCLSQQCFLKIIIITIYLLYREDSSLDHPQHLSPSASFPPHLKQLQVVSFHFSLSDKYWEAELQILVCTVK